MAAQLAATLVLLVGAGLMTRTLIEFYDSARSVDTSGLVVMRLTMPIQKYRTADQRKDLVEQLERRIGALPAVSSAAVAYQIPFSGGEVRRLSIDGRNAPSPDALTSVSDLYVGPRYFETLRLRLVQGREFSAADGRPGSETAIVNQRFAAMFFPREDAIGQRIRLVSAGPSAFASTPSAQSVASSLTIVGVSADIPQRVSPNNEQDPIVYAPYRGEPEPVRSASLIVRSRPGVDVVASIREAVRGLEPDVALYMVFTLDQVFRMGTVAQRVFRDIFAMLAGIALALSSVGLYAVTAYGVAQRTQEIGVRMALGAQRRQIVWLFARQTAMHLAIGTAIGAAGALAAGELLRSLLLRTSPRDPVVLLVVAAPLIIVAMMAAILPARRAARVDPMIALRHS